MADGAVDGMDSAWLALVPRYDLGADMLAQDQSRVFNVHVAEDGRPMESKE